MKGLFATTLTVLLLAGCAGHQTPASSPTLDEVFATRRSIRAYFAVTSDYAVDITRTS